MKKSLFLKAAGLFLAEALSFFLYFNLMFGFLNILPFWWLKLIFFIILFYPLFRFITQRHKNDLIDCGSIITALIVFVSKDWNEFMTALIILCVLVVLAVLTLLFVLICSALSDRYLWAEKVVHTWTYYTRKKYDPPEKKST